MLCTQNSEDILAASSALIQEGPANESAEQAGSQLPSAESQAEQADNIHISHPAPEPESEYDKLMKRKDYYEGKYHHYRKAYKAKDQEYTSLYNYHISVLKEYSTHYSRCKKESRTSKSFMQSANELLAKFRVKDLFQAGIDWSNDKKDLEQIQGQFSMLEEELKRSHEQSVYLEDRLKQADARFFKLQDEMLGYVERFDPSFDSQVLQGFVQLNKSIGKLSKSKDLKEIVLHGNPLMD
ncbi:hypothetical protein TWF730_002684 [Orbilia blumenaviensis]|uniref:Uncharacterized protein n=1 Tax=Orbilia blumenaviensis TaxID=1796055 RepID=A0AAV9UB79_9PEZI